MCLAIKLLAFQCRRQLHIKNGRASWWNITRSVGGQRSSLHSFWREMEEVR